MLALFFLSIGLSVELDGKVRKGAWAGIAASGSERPLRVEAPRSGANAGRSGIGASRPLRRIPAIVSFLNPQPAGTVLHAP
jgi:hypothetical protein